MVKYIPNDINNKLIINKIFVFSLKIIIDKMVLNIGLKENIKVVLETSTFLPKYLIFITIQILFSLSLENIN